jgi:phosphomannomutase
VIVRPSGTEPKVKVYLEVIEPVPTRADLPRSRATAETRLAAVRSAFEELTSSSTAHGSAPPTEDAGRPG